MFQVQRRGNRSQCPVILVVLDTLRHDLDSYHGRSGLPNLRRLSDESYMFTRAYAPSHWTLPSHASLFTGLMPHEHGARPPNMKLREDVETIAEVFLREGYFTACVTCNPFLSSVFGMVRGFKVTSQIQSAAWPLKSVTDFLAGAFNDDGGLRRTWRTVVKKVGSLLASSPRTDNGASVAIQSINRLLRREEGTPFLVVNLMEVHSPHHGRGAYSSWRRRFQYADLLDFERVMFGIMGGRLTLTDPLASAMEGIYWENASYLDDRLGELFRLLPREFRDDGFIIVTSDHGHLLGEKGLVGHSTGLAENLIRVPLIIRPPGGGKGTIIKQPVSIASIFSLLRAIAIDRREGFVPWLNWVKSQDSVVSEADGGDVPYVHSPRKNAPSYNRDLVAFKSSFGYPALACISNRWKLICHLGNQADELYDVEADSEEEGNLTKEEPSVLLELHEKLSERLLGAPALKTELKRDSLPLTGKKLISEIVLEQALGEDRKPVVVWTGGKDSNLVLNLALKVSRVNDLGQPPVLFVDHGQHFRETWSFIKEVVRQIGLRLVVAKNDDLMSAAGRDAKTVTLDALNVENQREALKAGLEDQEIPLSLQTTVGNHLLKTVALNRALREHDFDSVITGIRWDENPARSTEVFFSRREDPPHTRVHPILPWNEREVWEYTLKHEIPIHPLYTRGYRSFDGVRDSKPAGTVPAWEQDLEASEERAGRAQDKEKIMERLRALGYF